MKGGPCTSNGRPSVGKRTKAPGEMVTKVDKQRSTGVTGAIGTGREGACDGGRRKGEVSQGRKHDREIMIGRRAMQKRRSGSVVLTV